MTRAVGLMPQQALRPARTTDISVCADLRTRSITAYRKHSAIPYTAPPSGMLETLFEHLLRTDPGTFVVATSSSGAHPDAVAGFAISVRRGSAHFLVALYVEPTVHGEGLGTRLLNAVLPDIEAGKVVATATDSLQPVSNGLYARFGLIPSRPVFRLKGVTSTIATHAPITLVSLLDDDRATKADDASASVSEIDREVLGWQRGEDHAYFRRSSRGAWLLTGSDGTTAGYAYVSRDGEIGPLAVRDPGMLLPAIVAAARAASLDKFRVWIGTGANTALQSCVVAGLRIEGAPALMCESGPEPFIDFRRYVPRSLMLL